MSNLKLMEDGKLTLAGLLVFGKKPEEKKPQFVIKAVLFPGNSPAVSEYKDSRDITGNIPKIFEASRSFLIIIFDGYRRTSTLIQQASLKSRK